MSIKKENLEIETQLKGLKNSTVLIIFKDSDINAAVYNLVQSFKNPSSDNIIATVLVQESIYAEFLAILTPLLNTLPKPLHTGYDVAITTAKDMNLTTFGIPTPRLVLDVTHEYINDNGIYNGLSTFHVFRTAKEAVALVQKESLNFTHASIWHVNHANAYELVTRLKCKYYCINCAQVAWLNIINEHIEQGKSFVTIENNYHYETFPHENIQKSIVFPIGSIFAN